MGGMTFLEGLMAADMLINLGSKIIKEGSDLWKNPMSKTKEEIDALIAAAQPLADKMADDIDSL